MNFKGLLLPLLPFALLASPLVSAGEESLAETLPAISLKGFGTLGLARSNDDDVRFVRDLSQRHGLKSGWTARTDSVLGLQANLTFNEQTEAVIQVVSRYRYNGTYNPELTWAFVRQDFSPDFSARLGRLGTEFYMLADSRLVGYANLMLRPPPDYYGPLVFSYFDGLDVSATTRLESGPLHGLLRGKFYAGYAAEKAPYHDPLNWNLKGSLLVGGYADILSGPWQVRLGHTQIRFRHNQPMNQLPEVAQIPGGDVFALAPEMEAAGTWTRYDSLGVVYDKGPVQIQAMLSQINHETAAFENTRAAYLIAGYRLGQVTPYLGYSQVKSKAKTLSTALPPMLDGAISMFSARTHSDQHTVSLGARWDFRQNLALKAQADFIRGTPQSIFPFRDRSLAWDGRMNVYSVALDFVF